MLKGHAHSTCINSHWSRPAPHCLPKHGSRRGAVSSEHDRTHPHHYSGSRHHPRWDHELRENGTDGNARIGKLPLINGQWPQQGGAIVNPHTSFERRGFKVSQLGRDMIEEELGIAELRHRQEQDVLSSSERGLYKGHRGATSKEGSVEAVDGDGRESNEVLSLGGSGNQASGEETHAVATSHTSGAGDSRRYYTWRSAESGSPRYYASRTASSGKSSESSAERTPSRDTADGSSEITTSTAPTVSTSSWFERPTGTREAVRRPSDITDYWRRRSGDYGVYRPQSRPDSSERSTFQEVRRRPVSASFKRSYLQTDDDYDDDDDDEDDDAYDRPRVKFSRGDTRPEVVKGDREVFVRPSHELPTSSPVDYFGRPVQVLSGEKAHQQEELLRRQYEMAQRRRRKPVEEEAVGRPEEKVTVEFDGKKKGDREVVTSRPFDYFGRPVQVLSGDKAAQAEALLRRQYEDFQRKLREREKVEEARKRPEEVVHRKPLLPEEPEKKPPTVTFDRDWPKVKGDREVTSRPTDYFGRPVQVLTGEKAGQAEEMLRRQYEQYLEQKNKRQKVEEAVGRPVEFERQPSFTHGLPSKGVSQIRNNYEEAVGRPPSEVVRKPLEDATSPPRDYFGRPVQVLTGEKAGQQTELLRLQYEEAEARRRKLEEARRRPTEEVFGRPSAHNRRHHHGDTGREDHGVSVADYGLSGNVRLSREDIELMNKLSPDVRANFLRDLIKARTKEETAPERANAFLSRYENTWRSRVQATTAKPKSRQPSGERDYDDDDLDDDDDDYYQGDEAQDDVPLTTVSTEDTSSEYDDVEKPQETSAKATYDQSCLQDNDIGRSFVRAPRIDYGYVIKYERKTLTRPPYTHYVLARYKCIRRYELLYTKSDALYCRQREWVGERPVCVKPDKREHKKKREE